MGYQWSDDTQSLWDGQRWRQAPEYRQGPPSSGPPDQHREGRLWPAMVAGGVIDLVRMGVCVAAVSGTSSRSAGI